jgi:hypothetical protein
METTGTIHLINEKKQITDNFTIQEFVIKTHDTYPQLIQFQVNNKNINQLNRFKIGDDIRVKFNLTGREYAGKYYNTIVAWNISIKDVDKEMEKATNKINQILKQNNVNLSDENIDIPF